VNSGVIQVEGTDGARELRHGFAWRVHALGWSAPTASTRALDATLRFTVEAEAYPGCALVTHVPTLLRRDDTSGLWLSRLRDAEARDLVERAFYDGWMPRAGGGVLGVRAPYWYDRIGDQPSDGVLEHTQAPRYAGAREPELAEALGLPRQDGNMQDWPCEISGHAHIEDVVAFYERASDDLARFDAIALALFVYDDRLRSRGAPSPELEGFLRRDFPIHGHTIEYWCLMDMLTVSGELSLEPSAEDGFAITPAMRRLWTESVYPLQLA
jgi:hypothetical protein